MKELRKIIKETLEEITNRGFDAFHGSPTKIDKFVDSFVGGENAADAQGPGIYCTTNIDDAKQWGGFIHKIHIDGKFIDKKNPGDSVDIEELVKLAKMSEDWEMEAQNYDPDPEIGVYKSAETAIEYRNTEADVWQQQGANFFRYAPVQYVQAMTKLGYDGIVVDAPRDFVGDSHIIVYNPAVIHFKGMVE